MEYTDDVIAVLGAGGPADSAMTRDMARAGLAVRTWNQMAYKAASLAADGVYTAGTPADAVRGADRSTAVSDGRCVSNEK